MTDPNNEIAEPVDSKGEMNTPQIEADSRDAVAKDNLATESHAVSNDNAQKSDSADKRKNKKGKPKKEGGHKETVSNVTTRGFQLTSDGLLRHFLACRVCCYFLSGVQVLYGREVVDRMVREFDGTWMYVPLTREIRSLMQKTYGVQVDKGDFFVEHACEVCCRRFVIDLPEPADYLEPESEDTQALEEPDRREPIIFEPARSREEREPDWGRDRPMLLVEFKHRR